MEPRLSKSLCMPAPFLNQEAITVRLFEQGVPRSGLASQPCRVRPATHWHRVISFIDKTLVIAELEARKLAHDPTELITRACSLLCGCWYLGKYLPVLRAIPTGNLSYIDFMSPGILAQSVLFIAIFYASPSIWERDLGIVTSSWPRRPRAPHSCWAKHFRRACAPDASRHHLRAGAATGRQDGLEPAGVVGASCAPSFWARRSSLRFRSSSPASSRRASVSWHRASVDHAAVLCQQRHLFPSR